MTMISYALTLTPVVFVGVLFLFLGHPHAGVLFGTSVPLDFPSSANGRRILREYRRRSFAALVVFLVMGIVALQRGRVGFSVLAVPVELAIWMALYFVAVHQTRPFAIQPPLVRTAALAPDVSMGTTFLRYAAGLVPLLAAAVYLHWHWAQLPESFPVHWGIQGQANGWSHRTVGEVYRPIWLGAGMVGLLGAISFSTRYAPGGESLRRLVRTILLASSYLVALSFTWVALLPLIHASARMESGMVATGYGLAFLTAFTLLLIAIRTIRAQAQPGPGAEPYDGTQDGYWYAGMFYVNPNDAALLVPKRFGMGYTLNFGRPIAWVLLALFFLPLGFLLFYQVVR